MKKGYYYIGDPCYIFDESWGKVLENTGYFSDGKHELFGETIFGGGTAYGDGEYVDNFGRSYSVDAGLLAIIPVSLLNHDKKVTRKQVEKADCMHIIKMESDFSCSFENGVFVFGDILIDTRCLEDEEES